MNASRYIFKKSLLSIVLICSNPAIARDIYVSPRGSDHNTGTLQKPFATLARAQSEARKYHNIIHVYLRQGTYYLEQPLIFTATDAGTKQMPVIYQSFPNEEAVISGGITLKNLDWKPYQKGIYQTKVPANLQTDQLFINGERQVMARYPNFDEKQLIFNGSAADAISPERYSSWQNPAGGIIHIMHSSLWGDFSYRITGKNESGKLLFEGGWQNNRPPQNAVYKFEGEVSGVHKKYRYVENIFGELDAPGEWYLDHKKHVLYWYPTAGTDLSKAVVETVNLKNLVEFKGTQKAPVRFIAVKGITFRHTLRTFMENKEPILRSDWTIYRGGALLFDGAEDCSVEDSFLDQLGGNGVFVSNYNRRISISRCHIARSGSNGIAFMGDPAAVRSPLFNYDQRQSFSSIDQTPGPQTDNYPADCLVDNCLIYKTGQVEKQTAPIEIDLSSDITISHCSIYDVPRAGINIGDGCWGGHIVEFCDIFNTVKETGDHGSFNSWARDRWWGLTGIDLHTAIASQYPMLPKLDAVKPIILRNNRWRCDHGWDIDLDDGSSNYEIRNNLCLNGGIKNREGFYRVVENNIMVNNGFHPHVWYADCQDIFVHNIVWSGYRPAGGMPKEAWGKTMDYNFVQTEGLTASVSAKVLQSKSGRDEHSLAGDAMFIDPLHGDFRVKAGSPALSLGFVNFPMDQFGVQTPNLKAIALIPEMPLVKIIAELNRASDITIWGKANVRNILNQGEMSAYGTSGVTGVLVITVEKGSPLDISGLHKDDVIIGVNSNSIVSIADLLKPANEFIPGQSFKLKILRSQIEKILDIK